MNAQPDEKINNPLGLIEDDHCWQLVLCDALENIADQLPTTIDPRLYALTSEVLKKVICHHNTMEEEALFPVILKHLDAESNLRNAFAQLKIEHETDGEHALEIAHELDRIAAGGLMANPEMIGYMLRGFFESLRRHIHWENQTILPLAHDLLSQNDLNSISNWITHHPETFRCSRLLKELGRHIGHRDCPYQVPHIPKPECSGKIKDCRDTPSNDNI